MNLPFKAGIRNYKKEVVNNESRLSSRLEREIPSEHTPFPGDFSPATAGSK